MLNLKNTLDGYLKNVEVIGNTIQDTNNLADIRSVGDKVEGQELYKIPVVSCGKNLFDATVCVDGYILSGVKGEENSNASWFYSDYIRVKAGVTYRMGAYKKPFDPFYSCLYNEDRVFIKSNIGEVFTPSCDGYVRLSGIIEQKHVGQLEINSSITPYEPYKGDKLEILSPVQLEKVGDVADRIICKDGVWGIEKNIGDGILIGTESWDTYTNYTSDTMYSAYTPFPKFKPDSKLVINTHSSSSSLSTTEEYISMRQNLAIGVLKTKASNASSLKAYLSSNPVHLKGILAQPQFIPLPHDQQVKLRTFAGQTNIAFLTEIPGQIKAQVPKSLGATVNTHTEQIAELHNSLDRVKKLEETTVSTIETGSSFTTVDATSNGYFEDVKLEGKTLVNLCPVSSIEITKTVENHYTFREYVIPQAKRNTVYTICVNVTANQSTNSTTLFTFINNTSEGATGNMRINGTGYFVFTLKTLDIEFSKGVAFRFASAHSGNLGLYKCENLIILEGDHTNNPPSYFEGLMSVGQSVTTSEDGVDEIVVLSSTFEQHKLEHGAIDFHGNISSSSLALVTDFIPVHQNVIYKITDNLGIGYDRIAFYDRNKNFLYRTDSYYGSKASEIKAIANSCFMKVSMYRGTPLTVENLPYIEVSSIQDKKRLLYYNNETQTWEKPVLREWDTIEKHADGKYYYHKRSGEVVLNGSDSYWWSIGGEGDTTNGLTVYTPFTKAINDSSCVSDKLKTLTANTHIGNTDFVLIGTNTLVLNVSKSKLTTQDVEGFKAWLKANPTTVVYQLAQEEVYECTNIDLMTYNGETNYIINSGAISPKSLLKVHNNISNVVKILQEKVSLLENTFIAGLKSVLSGDMYSLATILYPEDFEQNDNTEQDIMVIPE